MLAKKDSLCSVDDDGGDGDRGVLDDDDDDDYSDDSLPFPGKVVQMTHPPVVGYSVLNLALVCSIEAVRSHQDVQEGHGWFQGCREWAGPYDVLWADHGPTGSQRRWQGDAPARRDWCSW